MSWKKKSKTSLVTLEGEEKKKTSVICLHHVAGTESSFPNSLNKQIDHHFMSTKIMAANDAMRCDRLARGNSC